MISESWGPGVENGSFDTGTRLVRILDAPEAAFPNEAAGEAIHVLHGRAVASLLEGSVVFLFVLALVKAGVIMQYYMHLDRVWSEEEAH